ncbi:MAG: FAD-dependent oxidoreductase [Saprospiraceae bacterium]|nr:FAD-dependent oxidoreductase [Saprospiraceae bacterium]
MKRRKFIIDAVTGLPMILFAPMILSSSCNNDDNNQSGKSVIVVGGGISGLAAAKKLKDNGLNVTLLESRDKVGGRLRTNRSLGFSFDEGASWIHGINGNPLTSLAEQTGMQTVVSEDDSKISYDLGGILRSNEVYDDTETELYEILETMKNSGDATKSFETVFNTLYPQYANDRLWKFFLSTYVTFDTGDLDKLSSLLYDEGEVYGGVEKIVTNGYDTLANYFANGLNINLNTVVTKIDYSQNKTIVTSASGTNYEADYVIVTVPLGVLKSNRINFVPALPATKQNAIQKLGMNCTNKFILVWDTAFWDDVLFISYTPEMKDKYNYFVNVKKYHPDKNALMTFAYADYARLTETMNDAEVIEDIMSHLKDMYGQNIPYPTNMLRTKWNSDENCLGSYSYTAIESEMRHFDDLAEEVNNKLFFAGEHTEIDYFSTVHGAYMSGLREADKILAL